MNDTLLKRSFLIDAIGCAASVVLLVAGADALAGPLGLSAGFLAITGWLLLPVTFLFLAIVRTGSRPLAMIGVAGNLAWVVASAAVIPILNPTPIGAAFIAAQAVAVLAIAWFEYRGLVAARAATL